MNFIACIYKYEWAEHREKEGEREEEWRWIRLEFSIMLQVELKTIVWYRAPIPIFVYFFVLYSTDQLYDEQKTPNTKKKKMETQ